MLENLKRYTPCYTPGTMRVIKTNGIQGYVKFSDVEKALYPCKEHSMGHECIVDNCFRCNKNPCNIDFSNANVEE